MISLSLKEDAFFWAKKILEFLEDYKRSDESISLREKGYDVTKIAGEIQAFFEKETVK